MATIKDKQNIIGTQCKDLWPVFGEGEHLKGVTVAPRMKGWLRLRCVEGMRVEQGVEGILSQGRTQHMLTEAWCGMKQMWALSFPFSSPSGSFLLTFGFWFRQQFLWDAFSDHPHPTSWDSLPNHSLLTIPAWALVCVLHDKQITAFALMLSTLA